MSVDSRDRGFTLIEALVALSLLGLLSIGLITSFRVGQESYVRIVGADRARVSVVIAQRFLRRTIESAYPFEPSRSEPELFGMQGSATQLAVTAPAPQSAGAGGHYRYEFFIKDRGSGSSDVAVRSGLDRNGVFAAEPREETLIDSIAAAEFSYFDSRASRWGGEWHGTHKSPQLVRLRVRFPERDSRVWPDLIVMPQITDDANCEFDSVSQRCREVSW